MADQMTPEQLRRMQILASLQAGATGQRPMMPGQNTPPGPDQRMTQDDEDRMRAVQLQQLANSPTKGMIAPNAADLAAKDANQQSQLDELGMGEESMAKAPLFSTPTTDQQDPRYQALRKRMGQ